jgi:hypothetical protein
MDFLSYLENPVALSHISELHTLLRKLSHTHALHELSLLLKNFYLQRKFCAYWLLTLNYILVYFWNAIWLFYQLFIHACSEANVRKKKICTFPSVFQLLMWSIQADMFLRPDALGSINLLSDSMISGRVCTTFGRELFSFSAKHILLLFACSFMLCCVVLCCVCFLSDWSQDFGILYTIFSFLGISFDFPYSFKLWFFLEYWNL